MDIGYAILNQLEKHNMTQKELAEKLKIGTSTVNGYIKGNHEPDYRTLIEIAKLFNITVDCLLNYTAETEPSEMRLIKVYRSLDPSRQEIVLQLAEFMEKQKK